MADREEILAALRRNRPEETPLPEVKIEREVDDLLPRFIAVVEEIGGKVIETTRDGIGGALRVAYPGLDPTYAPDLTGLKDLSGLAAIQLFVCVGAFGVSENGAIWLPERDMGVRIAPFITQHAAVMLDKTQIVRDMHAAYARIDIASEGFGLFVAGPSKTADIEQSLVLGAHGPRSLTVLLV